jgi:drug/metabolite transporter (DMT)-like permease
MIPAADNAKRISRFLARDEKRSVPMIPVSRSDKIKGAVLALLSALLLTAVFLFSTLAQRTLSGPLFLFWWFILALPALFLLHPPAAAWKKLWRRHWRFFLVYNLIEATGNILFFYLLRWIRPSIVSFFFSLTPLFGAVCAYIYLKERLSALEWFGGALSMAGVVLITWASPEVAAMLAALALLMTLLYAFNNVLVKRWILDVPPTAVISVRIICQAVFFAGLLSAAGGFRWPTGREMVYLTLGSLSGPAFGMYTVFVALQYLKATQLFLIRNLQPFFVTLAAALFLHQALTLRQLTGGMVIIAGVFLMLAAKWLQDKKSRNAVTVQGQPGGF